MIDPGGVQNLGVGDSPAGWRLVSAAASVDGALGAWPQASVRRSTNGEDIYAEIALRCLIANPKNAR
jgi:hypothetical protein